METIFKKTNRQLGGMKAWQTRIANGGGISAEHRKKIGDGNRGKKVSEEAKKKMSLAKIGKKLTEDTKRKLKGRIPWNKGKTNVYSKETIEKIKKARKRQVFTKETRINLSNALKNAYKNNRRKNYKGGITKLNHLLRGGIDSILWKEAVLKRDNYTCQKCGVRGGELHCHHINNFSDYPELRFAIDNGIVLCKKSHREFHKEYGFGNNTPEQLQEFLNKSLWE